MNDFVAERAQTLRPRDLDHGYPTKMLSQQDKFHVMHKADTRIGTGNVQNLKRSTGCIRSRKESVAMVLQYLLNVRLTLVEDKASSSTPLTERPRYTHLQLSSGVEVLETLGNTLAHGLLPLADPHTRVV